MSKQQSMGKCNLCGEMAGQASITRHLQACSPPEASGLSPASRKQTPGPNFHLAIAGCHAKAYWMHVAVPLTAPLGKLDDFLRQTWLECCGHLTAFEVGGNSYTSEPVHKEMHRTARVRQCVDGGRKVVDSTD